jgi:hypothetical protein
VQRPEICPVCGACCVLMLTIFHHPEAKKISLASCLAKIRKRCVFFSHKKTRAIQNYLVLG